MGVEDTLESDDDLTRGEVLNGQPERRAGCSDGTSLTHRGHIDHDMFKVEGRPSEYFCWEPTAPCPYRKQFGANFYCMVPERLFPPKQD